MIDESYRMLPPDVASATQEEKVGMTRMRRREVIRDVRALSPSLDPVILG
jgi:hypothetical protein